MGSLFITGNGFDLAHGIPTSYNDFRSFIIKLYPDALEQRDKILYLEEASGLVADEFAAEILLNTMDRLAGKDWSLFEEALAHINFDNKFPEIQHGEDEPENEDSQLMQQYLLYMDVLTSVYINCSKLWQEFFRVWLKDVEVQIDNMEFCQKTSLAELFVSEDMRFLTFNYTKTLQKLYGIKKVVHIHNRIGQKLIFGHGEDNATYGRMDGDDGPFIGSSMLDDMIKEFRKDTISPFKKYGDFFKKINQSVDKVYSYGFSYGKVDGVYIKEIVKRISPEATWYFTKFETKDSKALRIKKIKLRNYGFKGNFGIYEG